MKIKNILLTLSTIAICSSAVYARSSDYDENGFVIGFAPRLAAAAERVPAAPLPEPVVTAPYQAAGDNAAQTGPETALPPQPQLQAGPQEQKDEVPADYDESLALRLARNARNHALGSFTGWCYSYVADAMEMTGIITRNQWYSLGIGVNAAADFAYWANRNPAALRSQLKLAKIETPAAASELPMGAIVVYNRGVCGFSGRSGHIEVKVAPNTLCSDGCQPAYQECFGSPGTRAGISVYVPVRNAPKSDAKVCRLAGSGDGKCSYRCSDGSAEERPMRRADAWEPGPQSGPTEFCRQVLAIF